MSYFESSYRAQAEFEMWQARVESLRSGHFKIVPAGEGKSKYHLGTEFIGNPVTAEKLEEIFGERGRVYVQTFANKLARLNWRKFAVSRAKFSFERDPDMMFFRIGKILKGEKGVEIIYLGTGKTDKIPEIGNQRAAESWGFAVLNLRK